MDNTQKYGLIGLGALICIVGLILLAAPHDVTITTRYYDPTFGYITSTTTATVTGYAEGWAVAGVGFVVLVVALALPTEAPNPPFTNVGNVGTAALNNTCATEPNVATSTAGLNVADAAATAGKTCSDCAKSDRCSTKYETRGHPCTEFTQPKPNECQRGA